VKPRSPPVDGLIVVLRTALPVALLLAGWSVYRQLPATEQNGATQSSSETSLQIVLRQPSSYNGPMDVAVELYPIDVSAAQREYLSKPHAGTTFEEFLKGRMSGRAAIKGRLDKHGQVILIIGEGDWWIVAQLSGDNEIEWRLPVKVTGRKQSVELTADNAYGRTKVF
jgi:hypothetical protein